MLSEFVSRQDPAIAKQFWHHDKPSYEESTNRVEWTSNDNLLTVFYDGGCSLCTKEINHYIRLQNKHRGKHREHHLVDFYNIYAEPLHPELERRQISYLDTQKRMHVLRSYA